MKEREGISQKTYLHDPQMQTAVWRWPGGRGAVRDGGGGHRGEMRTSVLESTIKIKERTESSFTSSLKTLEVPAVQRLFWHQRRWSGYWGQL